MTPRLTHLRRLRLIMTYGTFSVSMPVINLFWQNRGLDQAAINASQAWFTIAVILLNIATGRWADRFGRRRSMLIGNAITALGFFGYAFAWDFYSVVFWEIVIGVGASFISGANTGLQRSYCQALGRSIAQERAYISGFGALAALLVFPVSSWLGADRPAVLIFVEGFLYLAITALVSTLPEYGQTSPRHTSTWTVIRDIASDRKLRWRILATTFSRELTHSPIWVFAPLMLAAGMPAKLLGIGWAVQSITETGLSYLGHHLHGRHQPHRLLALSVTPAITASILALCWHHWLAVMLLIAAMGSTRALTGILIAPLVTEAAHEQHVSTTESVAGTLQRIVYAGAVFLTGLAGNISPLGAIAANLAIFVTPLAVIWRILPRSEHGPTLPSRR